MRTDTQELKRLLEKILQDVPDGTETGIMLSGGLDSSALACILLSKGRSVRSISASFPVLPMYDETEYVEAIKATYPNLETNYFTPLDVDLVEELRQLISIIRKPIISGSALLQYFIMKRARELGMGNLIYGQWADELLGGYDYFLLARAFDDLCDLKLSAAAVNVTAYAERAKLATTDLILLRIIKTLVTSKGLRKAMDNSIPAIVQTVDIAQKTARALGINLIIPFADPGIVEFCRTLSTDRMVYRGETKIILREVIVDIAPKEILARKKKFGFFAPDNYWLLNSKQQLEQLQNPALLKEYNKYLINPNKRWNIKLWLTLSNFFLSELRL